MFLSFIGSRLTWSLPSFLFKGYKESITQTLHIYSLLYTCKRRLSYPDVLLRSSTGGEMCCVDKIFNSVSVTVFEKP
jgi:hypothetical protein